MVKIFCQCNWECFHKIKTVADQHGAQQAVAPRELVAPRAGLLQFDFVKAWTTRYVAYASNSNAINSTGLRPALAAAI